MNLQYDGSGNNNTKGIMRILLLFLLIALIAFTPLIVLANPLTVYQSSDGYPATAYVENSVVNGKISFTYQLTAGTTRFFEWRGSYWLHYDGWEEIVPPVPFPTWQEVHFSRNYYDSPLPPMVGWIDIINGNRPEDYVLTGDVSDNRGDVDYSGTVDIADAIMVLQVLAGMSPSDIHADVAINNNFKLAMDEVLFVLQVTAGVN